MRNHGRKSEIILGAVICMYGNMGSAILRMRDKKRPETTQVFLLVRLLTEVELLRLCAARCRKIPKQILQKSKNGFFNFSFL